MSGNTGNAVIVDDTTAARRELRADGQYGGYSNAEELIRGHFASISPEVRAALKKKVNEEATKQARLDDVGDDITVPNGGTLVDWAIRGEREEHQVISYVWEDDLGIWHRGVQGFTDKYRPPVESDGDRLVREQTLNDREVAAAAAQGSADIDARVEQIRSELAAQHAKDLAEMREEMEDRLAALGESASQEDAPKTGAEAKIEAEAGDNADGTPADGADADADGGEAEVKWPHNHEDMDKLAKKGGLRKADLPSDWDDLKLPAKQEFLEGKDIKPEAEGS